MLLDAVRRFLAAHAIPPCRVVVACSGGFDSTALLVTMAELRSDGYEIVCGHVNHHLRGAESDQDESYLAAICSSLNVTLDARDGTVAPELMRASGIEGAAREVRSRLFQDIRDRGHARYVATAHHRDDQAETILMRLFTGTGLAGLRGIHPVRDDGLIRPFLDVRRSEIERFLQSSGLTPRHDRMNDDPRFLRTRIRQTLRDYDTDVSDELAAIAAQARQVWDAVEKAIAAGEDAVVREESTLFRTLPEDPFLRRALLHRHIRRLDAASRDVSAADLDRLAGQATLGKRISVTRSLELLPRDGGVLLRRRYRPPMRYDLPLEPDRAVTIPDRQARMSVKPAGVEDALTNSARSRQLFRLPAGAVPTFVVRNRRPGDRFHPLGSPGAKKLGEFLIDRKIAAEERDSIPLLTWEGQIIWVTGVEVAETFRLGEMEGDTYVAWLDPIEN